MTPFPPEEFLYLPERAPDLVRGDAPAAPLSPAVEEAPRTTDNDKDSNEKEQP